MRRPEKEDVTWARGWTAARFAEWLHLGLIGYLFDRMGRGAFAEVRNFIENCDDVVDDLMIVFAVMDRRERVQVGLACAELLRGLDLNDHREAYVAEHVLRIASRLRSSSVLRVLADKAFSVRTDGPGAAVYDQAFATAQDLARFAGPAAGDCIRHLITMELFRPVYAAPALLALCEAEPDGFGAHWTLLAPWLELALGHVRGGAEGQVATEEIYAGERASLIEAISRRVVNKRLLLVPCEPEKDETRNWWAFTLASTPELHWLQVTLERHAQELASQPSQPQHVLESKPFRRTSSPEVEELLKMVAAALGPATVDV